MDKLLSVVAALAVGGFVNATAIVASVAQDAPRVVYTDAIRQCGAEWRAREDKNVKGVAEWNKFRVECIKKTGFVPKRAR